MVLNQLKLPDGRLVKIEEWGELPLWSTAIVGRAQATDVNFFNYGMGDSLPLPGGAGVRTATQLDTNMEKGAQLLGGEMFVFAHTIEPAQQMDELTAGVPPITMFELGRMYLKEVMAKTYVLFTIAQKTFVEGFVHWVPSGSGPFGNDIQNAASVLTNGEPSPAAIRRYNIPVHISTSSEVFRGFFKYLNGGLVGTVAAPAINYRDWRWTWKLEGLRRRQSSY